MSTSNPPLTSVGPGTPLGKLLRGYWLPFLPVADLDPGAERPVRVQLLTERLVVFRNGRGEAGLIDAICPHADADLFWGVKEEDGLRCTYHGWKFAVDGKCIDTPMHGPGRGYDTRAFPVVEQNGLFWTHLGRAQEGAGPPEIEWHGTATLERQARPIIRVLSELMSRSLSDEPFELCTTDDGVALIQHGTVRAALSLPGLVSLDGAPAHYAVPAEGAATVVIHLGAATSSQEDEAPAESTLQAVGDAVATVFGTAIESAAAR